MPFGNNIDLKFSVSEYEIVYKDARLFAQLSGKPSQNENKPIFFHDLSIDEMDVIVHLEREEDDIHLVDHHIGVAGKQIILTFYVNKIYFDTIINLMSSKELNINILITLRDDECFMDINNSLSWDYEFKEKRVISHHMISIK